MTKFGARWYLADQGSWTQQDTLDAPLDPANADRYAYAGDDPINAYDVTGSETFAEFTACDAKSARGGAITGTITGALSDVETGVLPGAAAGFVIGTVSGVLVGLNDCLS